MKQGVLTVVKVVFRVALGLRFLSSGLSNIRRWPNPVKDARLVFPLGHSFFGAVAVALMVLGGGGLALGFLTRVAALMIFIFLIPTFKIRWHSLRTLPAAIERVRGALANRDVEDGLQLLARQAIHAHEICCRIMQETLGNPFGLAGRAVLEQMKLTL